MSDQASTPDTDWKSIAHALAKRVNFALTQIEGCKAGFFINNQTGDTRHWRDYMADGLEMVPGVTVDREIMYTMDLPRSQRKKAREKIKAERDVIAASKGVTA